MRTVYHDAASDRNGKSSLFSLNQSAQKRHLRI